MNTDSLYLALTDENLDDSLLPEKKTQWARTRKNDRRDNFVDDAEEIFFPRTSCAVQRKLDKRKPVSFQEKFRNTEMLSMGSKTYCCHHSKTDMLKLSSKGLNKRTLKKDSGDAPMSKYRLASDAALNLQSTNRRIKNLTYLVGTDE